MWIFVYWFLYLLGCLHRPGYQIGGFTHQWCPNLPIPPTLETTRGRAVKSKKWSNSSQIIVPWAIQVRWLFRVENVNLHSQQNKKKNTCPNNLRSHFVWKKRPFHREKSEGSGWVSLTWFVSIWALHVELQKKPNQAFHIDLQFKSEGFFPNLSKNWFL